VGELQCGGDGRAGGGKHRGHFTLCEGQETLHHHRVKLRAAGEDQPAQHLENLPQICIFLVDLSC